MRTIRIGMGQINCTVGALVENVAKIRDYARRAADAGVDLLAFPELAVCGYPPEDLLFKSQFVSDTIAALDDVREASRDWPDLTLLVGCLDRRGTHLYNGAAVISAGSVLNIYHKQHLPNYGVFDEKRYFTSGRDYLVLEVAGVSVGVSVCEDIWHKTGPPETEVAVGGAEIIVNINASPYHIGKPEARDKHLSGWAKKHGCALVYVNLVGGQDELVFDGRSLVFDPVGNRIAAARQFTEDLLIVDIDADEAQAVRRARGPAESKLPEKLNREITKIVIKEMGPPDRPPVVPESAPSLSRADEILSALELGARDYLRKNGFSHVVLGLSGGIDSALTAAIAVEALGKDNVTAVFMPSRYTSTASLEDAAAVAENLAIEMHTIHIEPGFRAYLGMLEEVFDETHTDITEENLQARIRGNILMALCNKYGWLLLSTGNKSETSVGYTTLYGDMSGGFAILKDVSKTLVFDLSRRLNEKSGRAIIPERILTKPPSAELSPDQKDSDTLPEYAVLDPILSSYIEEEKSLEEIIAEGFSARLVEKIADLVDRSEYKRRQAPPGVKITSRAFGRDWRVPITNRYRRKPTGTP